MSLSFCLPLVLGLLGQAEAPAPGTETPDEIAARLELMKGAVAKYAVHPADDPAARYRLQPEPVLRFKNTVGDAEDGAIFLWLGADDRPEAAVQVFAHRNGNWFHEFTSLSTRPIVAETGPRPAWSTTEAGIEFKPVPGAPKPAESSEQRLRQMHALLNDFLAENDFGNKGWQKLRLLPKPFARYGKPGPGPGPIDGALFSYVLTTDPEVYLLLEARPGKDGKGPEWHYGFAPMTVYPVRGSWKGREVWSLPYREAWKTPNATFSVHYAGPRAGR